MVLYVFFPLVFGYLRDRRRFVVVGSSRTVTQEKREARADALLDALLRLGPTFIKLGQLLSTRPDILPPEYIAVLSELQDRVPPEPWEAARDVVDADLGPVDERFDSFETEAISGASLGQVYRATVDGEAVAVKVRRPNVESIVNIDLTVLGWVVPVVKWFVGPSRAFSLENVTGEFAETIREEMDYEREARMLDEIRDNFRDDSSVRMPEVLPSHSTERVLTMEYVPGTKITDVATINELGLDRGELAASLQRAYLQMVMEDGVFHADPHPGNLAVQPDGTLVFYDFGMSGYVDSFIQQKIIAFYVSVANRDIEGILDALIEMGTLRPDADRETMGHVMELAIEDAQGRDIEQYRIQQIVQQVEDTIYEFPFRLPRNLALILRVATVVEGVCVTLDEEFDFIAVASAFLTERGYREEGVRQAVESIRSDVREAAWASLRLPPKLDSVVSRADRGDLVVQADVRDSNAVVATATKRVVVGILLAASMIGTAIVYTVDVYAAGVGVVVAVVLGVWLWLSFRDRQGIQSRPQFTRQSLRERRREEDRNK